MLGHGLALLVVSCAQLCAEQFFAGACGESKKSCLCFERIQKDTLPPMDITIRWLNGHAPPPPDPPETSEPSVFVPYRSPWERLKDER